MSAVAGTRAMASATTSASPSTITTSTFPLSHLPAFPSPFSLILSSPPQNPLLTPTSLWGVENSGDSFTRTINGQTRDIHNNNPGEKIHYMGDISTPNNAWYGYPTCFTVWQPSDFTDKKFSVGDWFVQSPNSTFNDLTCSQRAVAPALTLFPHSAPIDCKFDASNENMYITYHGSWNRVPTTGFKLVRVPFTRGQDGKFRPVAELSSTEGAVDVLWNLDVTRCQGNGPAFSSGCFRPAGLAFDKGGRLFMTSDVAQGEVWVLGRE